MTLYSRTSLSHLAQECIWYVYLLVIWHMVLIITLPADPLQFGTPATPVDVLDKATEEGDLSEVAFCLPNDPTNVHDQGIDKPPTCYMEDDNPFHHLPDNYPLTELEPSTGSTENENPFHHPANNRPLTPIEPPACNVDDENPFQQLSGTHSLSPTPDLHLQDDNSGPSEPISWAFQRQGLGDPFDMDSQSSLLGGFKEENSSQRPTSPSPTAIRDVAIDPTLLQPSPAGPTLWIERSSVDDSSVTTQTVTPASSHPLTSFSTSRLMFVFDRGLLKVTSATMNTPSPAKMFGTEWVTAAPPATSPCRSLVATTIITSLSGGASTPTSTSTPIPLPSIATLPSPLTATPATPPAPLLALPLGVETQPAQKPVNLTLPKGPLMQSCSHGWGWGCGGRGRGGRGQGSGVAKENTTEDATNRNPNPDIHQIQPLSAAACHWINILNKRVYAPDGTYHSPPLGTSHSLNIDGLHPCVTFNGPPPAAVPKKQLGHCFQGRHCFRQIGKKGACED